MSASATHRSEEPVQFGSAPSIYHTVIDLPTADLVQYHKEGKLNSYLQSQFWLAAMKLKETLKKDGVI